MGTGSGFQPPLLITSLTARWIATADMNLDGFLDLVVVQASSVGVMLGHGNGNFGAIVSRSAGANLRGAAVEDLNGDNKPDIVVSDNGGNAYAILNTSQ